MKKYMTKQEYSKYVDKKSPDSKHVRNMARAFMVGGAICTIGQIFLEFYKSWGYSKEFSSTLTVMTMVFLGALFTGLNIYDELGRFAGAGSIVPITGFANSVVSPAMEFKSEGYVLGVGSKMFLVAGPVIVYGLISSAAAGLLYYFLNH